MNKKTNKKNTIKSIYKPRKKKSSFINLGNINPSHGRILVLIISIIFVTTVMTMSQVIEKNISTQTATQSVQIKKSTPLDNEIKQMVAGYPIEQMTPYILKQNPVTAMFMIAIAKKESAWGIHHPVLAGNDCFNYWGFRLKSDKMGSGGHTCFDSPEQAVSVIAQRIDELVKEEKIDTPQKMVVWKCGYNCDGPAAAGSQKWIKDVGYYYNELLN